MTTLAEVQGLRDARQEAERVLAARQKAEKDGLDALAAESCPFAPGDVFDYISQWKRSSETGRWRVTRVAGLWGDKGEIQARLFCVNVKKDGTEGLRSEAFGYKGDNAHRFTAVETREGA